MKLHIKTRMIINGVLSVTISMLLAMIIVYFLVQKQSKDGAVGRIEHARQVVSAELENKKANLIEAGETLGKSRSLNNILGLVWDLVDTKQDISYTTREMVGDISDLADVLGVRKAVIYDVDGNWLAGVLIKGEQMQLFAALTPGGKKYLQIEVSVGKRPAMAEFKETDAPLSYPLMHSQPMPKESATTMFTTGKDLWLNVSTPAISIDEGNKLRGQVVVSLPIGQEFTGYVSTITGTQVNLF